MTIDFILFNVEANFFFWFPFMLELFGIIIYMMQTAYLNIGEFRIIRKLRNVLFETSSTPDLALSHLSCLAV